MINLAADLGYRVTLLASCTDLPCRHLCRVITCAVVSGESVFPNLEYQSGKNIGYETGTDAQQEKADQLPVN